MGGQEVGLHVPGTGGKYFSILALVHAIKMGARGAKGRFVVFWRGTTFLSTPLPRPQEAARDHGAVVALYRSHLLYAIQVSSPGSCASLSICTGEAGRGQGRLAATVGREGTEKQGQEQPGVLSAPPHPRVRWMKTCSAF